MSAPIWTEARRRDWFGRWSGTGGHGRRGDEDPAGAEPVDLPRGERAHRGSRGRDGALAVPALHLRMPRRKLHRTGADDDRRIRKHPPRPTWFLNAPGHESVSVGAGAAIVLERRERYVLVEKIGIAGEVAAQEHQRLA